MESSCISLRLPNLRTLPAGSTKICVPAPASKRVDPEETPSLGTATTDHGIGQRNFLKPPISDGVLLSDTLRMFRPALRYLWYAS